MTLIARHNSSMHAPPFRVLGRLMALFIVAAFVFGGIAVAQAQEHQQSHARLSAVHAQPSVTATHELTAEELEEVRNHGHHHTGNPLEDLVTTGHSHVGCQCASSTAEIFVLVVVPNTALVVMRKPRREHDSPPTDLFRPPIA